MAIQDKYRIPLTTFPFILLFVTGYLLTFKSFNSNLFEYSAYSLVAMTSCVVLIAPMQFADSRVRAILVALSLFLLTYFIRFYWIALDPSPVKRMLAPGEPFLAMVADRSALLKSFELSVVAFSVFCLSAAAALCWLRKGRDPLGKLIAKSDSIKFGVIARWPLLITAALMTGLAYTSYIYHIGEMGAPSGDALPFRLKGIIFHARTMLIPLTIVLLIHLAERGGDMITSRLAILILVLHGIADMFLRNSRSTLLLTVLLLLFLMLADGIKLRRVEKALLGALAALAFFLVPIMTEFRQGRLNYHLSHIDALFRALDVLGSDWLLQAFKGIEFVLFRMPGLECLWNMLALGAEPLGVQSIDVIKAKNGIAGYLTYSVYSFKESDNHLFAPGFAGWHYLVGGLPAITLGSFVAGVLSVAGWNRLNQRYFESGPVAQVFFLWMLFIALTEGALDSMANMFVVGVMTIVAMELSLRLVFRRAPFNNYKI